MYTWDQERATEPLKLLFFHSRKRRKKTTEKIYFSVFRDGRRDAAGMNSGNVRESSEVRADSSGGGRVEFGAVSELAVCVGAPTCKVHLDPSELNVPKKKKRTKSILVPKKVNKDIPDTKSELFLENGLVRAPEYCIVESL